MRDHLKDYFPERFEETKYESIGRTLKELLMGLNRVRHKMACESVVIDVWNDSNEIKLLRGALKKYGCEFDLLRHVSCELCKKCHGGFDPDTNQIVMCYNAPYTHASAMKTLAHEMIHMFDYCRAKFDFNNLEHVACSEIRAANLTNCSIKDGLKLRTIGFNGFMGRHKDCVREVASKSLEAYSPETSAEEVDHILDKVFPVCYNDLEPFGRRPMNNVDQRHSYRERFYYGYT